MLNCLAKSATKPFLVIIAAAAFAPGLTVPSRAQQGTYQSRRTPAVTRDMRYSEWTLKDLERNGKKPVTKEGSELAWVQIREDFKQIQVVHNNMLRLIAENSALDHKVISAAAAEVNKRAGRLKSNLSFPLPEPRQTPPYDELRTRTMLSALGGLIIRFVRNPVFKDTEVINAEHSAQAGRDLERIVEFSDELKRRSAEELKRINKKAF